MKVIKIGGGCLRDGRAAGKIIELIAGRGQGDIFVLSAFYGVTDVLIAGIDGALENEFLIEDITERTVSADFSRNKTIHRCWELRKRK